MLSEAYKYVVVGLSTLAATFLIKLVADMNNYTPGATATALVLALTTAVVFTLVHFVFNGLKEWDWFRKIPTIESRYRFEGKWIEIYDLRRPNQSGHETSYPKITDRLYAIFDIVYDSSVPDSYFLKGIAYDEKGNYHSKWSSRRMDFDTSKNVVGYFYEGSYHLTGEEVSGFGALDFNSPGTRLNFGTGFFLDYGRSSDRVSFEFCRLEKSSIEKIVKNKDLPFYKDFDRHFIEQFHKELHKDEPPASAAPSADRPAPNVVGFEGRQ